MPLQPLTPKPLLQCPSAAQPSARKARTAGPPPLGAAAPAPVRTGSLMVTLRESLAPLLSCVAAGAPAAEGAGPAPVRRVTPWLAAGCAATVAAEGRGVRLGSACVWWLLVGRCYGGGVRCAYAWWSWWGKSVGGWRVESKKTEGFCASCSLPFAPLQHSIDVPSRRPQATSCSHTW